MSLTLPKGIVLAAAAVVSLVVPIATGAVAASPPRRESELID